MPTVPAPGNPVASAATPNVRISGNAPVEAFGGGQAAQGFQAAQGAAKVAYDIAADQKQKADSVRVQDALNQTREYANELFWNPKTGAMGKKGKDAFGIQGQYLGDYDKFTDELSNDLANEDQRFAFHNAKGQFKSQLDEQLNRHVFQESKDYAAQVTKGAVEGAQNNAVLNYNDPRAIQQSVNDINVAIRQHAQDNGVDDQSAQLMVDEAVSKTHQGVISRMLDQGDAKLADQYFKSNKGSISPESIGTVEKAIDNGITISQGQALWGTMRGYKLPDGTPDEAKMRAQIMARTDVSDEKKEKLWAYVKSRSSEKISDDARRDNAVDRSFMNNVIDYRKNNVPLDEALKLVNKYSKDEYDAAAKADAVRKTYAPPSESNPESYIALWERVQDNAATVKDIDEAKGKNLVNVSDWEALRKDYYRINTEGKNPEQKATWERIKVLAEEKFGDKTKRDQFLYVLHANGRGMSSEQLWKTAQDQLATDPNTGVWGFFQNKQYKTDLARLDAQNLAIGQAQSDLGKQEVQAIGQGAEFANNRKFNPADLDAFAAQFGGYQNIKQGTVVNSAVKSLIAHGQLVTPGNIRAVLTKFPDGKY